jgi:hypothetical protein
MLRLYDRERNRLLAGILLLAAGLAAAILAPRASAGYREKMLYRFCPRDDGSPCP